MVKALSFESWKLKKGLFFDCKRIQFLGFWTPLVIAERKYFGNWKIR